MKMVDKDKFLKYDVQIISFEITEPEILIVFK